MSAVRWAGRHWRLLGVLLAAVVVWVWLGTWFAAGLLVVCGLLARRTRARGATPAKRPRWWTPDHLSGAMVAAGVLRPTPPNKKGQPTVPKLFYRGKPVRTDHGTTVVVGLPDARTLTDVLGRREALAAALRVPSSRLEVSQGEDDAAGTVRIHVAHGRPKETAATVATAEPTNWREPVRIGCDSRGVPVHLETFEHNTLIAGRPGSGKTVTSRIELSHFLLDPSTAIYVLDGKGSVDDYGACRRMCARFVSGTDEDAVPGTLAMLTEVLDEVRRRNTVGGGATHPGILVLLEELQDVRAGASKEQREQLDNILGRIVRMCRAVGVVVLISTQRPTVEDLPSGIRNLLSQRLVLMLRNGADAALVLGTAPGVALPSRRGQALFTNGGPVVPVALDRLTDEAWVKVCQRAERLRAPSQMDADTREFPALSAVPSRQPAMEPLIEAVVAVLANADPRGISASQLHAALPEWVQETYTSTSLGMALARHSKTVERAHLGSARVWRLTSAGRSDAAGVV